MERSEVIRGNSLQRRVGVLLFLLVLFHVPAATGERVSFLRHALPP